MFSLCCVSCSTRKPCLKALNKEHLHQAFFFFLHFSVYVAVWSQCSHFCHILSYFTDFPTLARTHTHTKYFGKMSSCRGEWLMTPFTAQTPHNQRCWGSVSARRPVWVITPGTQLIYYPTINQAVHTCCLLQCPWVLVQSASLLCPRYFIYKNDKKLINQTNKKHHLHNQHLFCVRSS